MKVTLIYTDGSVSNNNKFYKLTLAGDDVIAEWGRVGTSGSTQTYSGGQNMFERKKREKLSKGYTEVKTLDNVSTDKKFDLSKIAQSQIKGNYGDLVEKLVEYNVHSIISGTSVSYNISSGLFSTPLGIVTSDTVSEAKIILDKIIDFTTNSSSSKPFSLEEANKYVSTYLRLIPKNLGMKRPTLDNVFHTPASIQQELDILESLENSISLTTSQDEKSLSLPNIWNVNINIVNDSKIINYIEEKYQSTKKSNHSSSSYKIKNIYETTILDCLQKYSSCPVQSNKAELWHGTGVSNILSILKSGLKKSPPSTAAIAGKLMGNGVYFASSSTKSLNYSSGFWRSSDRSSSCFMFLCDVNLGTPYYPTQVGSTDRYVDGKNYHSTIALPKNIPSLINEEYIIFNEDQFNLKYLIEFEQ